MDLNSRPALAKAAGLPPQLQDPRAVGCALRRPG